MTLLGLDAIGTTLQRAEQIPVGASLLAMIVNDNASLLAKRGALESIASKLAPTEDNDAAGA
ncbi:hypothetical protein Q7W64_29715, partial [Pseudomonas sp. LLb12B]